MERLEHICLAQWDNAYTIYDMDNAHTIHEINMFPFYSTQDLTTFVKVKKRFSQNISINTQSHLIRFK